MITIPKSVCTPCLPPLVQIIQNYPLVNQCQPCSVEKKEIILSPIINTICECPSKSNPIEILSVKRIDQIKTNLCYQNFILSISTTKLCKTGPQCLSL